MLAPITSTAVEEDDDDDDDGADVVVVAIVIITHAGGGDVFGWMQANAELGWAIRWKREHTASR